MYPPLSLSPISNPYQISIIGAGKVGSTLAQRIIQQNLANVILLDIVPGQPQGIALDLMEARALEQHHCQIIGTNDYQDTKDSDIIVISAGQPRLPGMTRDDLIKTNAAIVIPAVKQAIAYSPQAIIIIVTNPLDVLTYLVYQAINHPTHKIMGMAGVLDSARFQAFIAHELSINITDIQTMVLGGHGDLMVPLISYTTIQGIPLTKLMTPSKINELVERTRQAGLEIVNLLLKGGAYYAPASAIYLMLSAILNNQNRIIPASVFLEGQYGLKDIFVGVPSKIAKSGVSEIIELELTPGELTQLHTSAQSVRQTIAQVIDLI